jgi:RHS repeat-associated protein
MGPEGDPRRFTGKERDAETELHYFGARYYRSVWGRFTSVDPVMNREAALRDPQRWNRYSYVLNNPLALADPDGRDPQNPPGSSPQVPSPIHCRPDVIIAMKDAWSRSNNARQNEQGPLIEAGFRLDGTPDNYTITKFLTNESGELSMTVSIDQTSPTFATFHVHPKGGDANKGRLSTPDENRANAFQAKHKQVVKMYIMSWHGLSMYDPTTKQSTQVISGIGFLSGIGCVRIN